MGRCAQGETILSPAPGRRTCSQCAYTLTASSAVKMAVKTRLEVSSARPSCVADPCSSVRLSVNCASIRFATKFCREAGGR